MTSRKQPTRLVERDDLDGDRAKVAALLDRVEAPRSSASARARVWSRLNETAPPKKPWALAALSGVTLAVVIGLSLRAIEMPAIEVIGAPGRVTIRENVVQTQTRPGRVKLGGLVIAELAPHTELRVVSGDGELDLELLAGGITATPLAGEEVRLRISAGRYALEGDGVAARVARVGAEELAVEVLAGEASLSEPSGTRRLSAGDKVEPASITTAVVEAPPPPSPSVPAPPPRPRTKRRAVARSPEPDVTPPIPDAPDWDRLYRAAIGEPDASRAIPMFDRLAKSGTGWAETSAFQAARLEMKRGRCRDAIDRFEPLFSGMLGAEARLNVIECELELGRLDAAARSIEMFLRAHPSSEREAELERLRGELEKKL